MSSKPTAKELDARRRAGRSWREIARDTGLSVAEIKTLVNTERTERRKALAHSAVNERARGLLDMCDHCHHFRKLHSTSACLMCGPVRYDPDSYFDVGCDAFVESGTEDWTAARPKSSFRLNIEAHRLTRKGLLRPDPNAHTMFGGSDGPDVPKTRLKTLVARARRREKRLEGDGNGRK